MVFLPEKYRSQSVTTLSALESLFSWDLKLRKLRDGTLKFGFFGEDAAGQNRIYGQKSRSLLDCRGKTHRKMKAQKYILLLYSLLC
jgi:hypothetical protein